MLSDDELVKAYNPAGYLPGNPNHVLRLRAVAEAAAKQARVDALDEARDSVQATLGIFGFNVGLAAIDKLRAASISTDKTGAGE